MVDWKKKGNTRLADACAVALNSSGKDLNPDGPSAPQESQTDSSPTSSVAKDPNLSESETTEARDSNFFSPTSSEAKDPNLSEPEKAEATDPKLF